MDSSFMILEIDCLNELILSLMIQVNFTAEMLFNILGISAKKKKKNEYKKNR